MNLSKYPVPEHVKSDRRMREVWEAGLELCKSLGVQPDVVINGSYDLSAPDKKPAYVPVHEHSSERKAVRDTIAIEKIINGRFRA